LVATERDEQARTSFRERLEEVDPERLRFVDESSTNIALTPRYARAPKGERAHGKAPQELGQERHPHFLDHAFGDGSLYEHRGSIGYRLVRALHEGDPGPDPGDRTDRAVMDNLSVHRSKWVRELIEERGCQLWLLPPYSPDFKWVEKVRDGDSARLLRW
jgi:hypothetical protein